jgi:S1-C subfamily serine protease
MINYGSMMRKFIFLIALLFSIASFAGGEGFKIVEVQAGSIYQKVGLKNGDIVEEVNGAELASVEAFSSWISKTKAGDKIDISIIRDARTKSLKYSIK